MENLTSSYPPSFQKKLDAFPSFADYFKTLDREQKQELIQIFMNDHLIFPATYDNVFKYVFDPKRHPERLSRFLSLILKQNITIIAQLPSQTFVDSIYTKGIIMDLLVKLEDGSLADIEMQQIPLDFPTHRAAVHSARLINQQYQTVKAQKKTDIRYTDVRKVYTIVFFAKASSAFHELPNTYLHHSKHRTEEGLELELLQEYFFVELDKFEKLEKQINTEEKAWLKLMMARDFDTLQTLSKNFTALQEPANDVILFSKQTKEEPRMIWDVDEYVIKDMIARFSKERDTAVAERDTAVAERDVAVAERDAAVAEKDAAVAEKDALIKAISVLQLNARKYNPNQIAEELSLPLEEVQHILNQP